MEQAKNGSCNGKHPDEESPFIPPTSTEKPIIIKNGDGDNNGKVFQFQAEGNVASKSEQNGHGHHEGPKKKGFCGAYTGIVIALFAGFVFTCGTVLAKYMKGYHPFTLATYRLQGIAIPSILMVLYATKVKKIEVFEPMCPLGGSREKAKTFVGVLLRASIGCTALYLHFYALQYLTVADVTVVFSCRPIFVTLAAFFLLGETCGIFPICMSIITMVGIGIITRPPILTGEEEFNTETLIGAGFALGSAITDTIVVIIIRYLKKIHVSVMMLFLGFWGSIQSVICSYVVGELRLPENGIDWALAIGMAAVALLNQAGMNLALQYEEASPIALTRTMDFIFAFILQFFIMGVSPDLFSLTGATIIVLCVFLTAFRKWLMGLPKTHAARKRYWFVLK